MKTLITFIAYMAIVLMPSHAASQTKAAELQNIQQQIDGYFKAKDNASLNKLVVELDASYNSNQNPLYLYWKGYAQCSNCAIYLSLEDKKAAEKALDDGIEALKYIKDRGSEDYALLGMMQGYSCQFAGFPGIIKRSMNAVSSVDKALELDTENLRAYYVYAMNDFYRPENYGGGKQVEEYALKALGLPDQRVADPTRPSWGRQEVYELLTNFYIRSNNTAKAREYVNKGLAEFPDSEILNANKAKL